MKPLLIFGTLFCTTLLQPAFGSPPDEWWMVNDGDPRVSRWDSQTGTFIGDAALLTDSGIPFRNNSDVEWDGTHFYTIAAGDARIRRFREDGTFSNDVAQLHDKNGPVLNQTGLAFDGTFFYTTAPGDARVRQFTVAGEYIQDLTELQDASGKVGEISGIAVAGDFIYIVCHGSAEIRKFDVGGHFVEAATVIHEGTRPFPFHTGLSALPAEVPK